MVFPLRGADGVISSVPNSRYARSKTPMDEFFAGSVPTLTLRNCVMRKRPCVRVRNELRIGTVGCSHREF